MSNNFDNPEIWIKAGKWLAVGVLFYYCWNYIILLLAMVGAMYLYREWKKDEGN